MVYPYFYSLRGLFSLNPFTQPPQTPWVNNLLIKLFTVQCKNEVNEHLRFSSPLMCDPQGAWYLIKFCPNDLGPKDSPPSLPVLPRAGGCGYPRGGRSEKELEDPKARRKPALLRAPGLGYPFLCGTNSPAAPTLPPTKALRA